uniref:Aromatic-L-amino-acid decarboxylase n=1 Tax=Oryza rufipogon TaxID=4529 RepID=A0A0E0QE63_ORYRU
MGSLDTNPTAFSAFPAGEGETFQPLNADDVRSYLHKAVDFISDYYKSVESMPVLPNVKPGYLQDELRASPPTYSAPFDVTMKELRSSVVPGMTHWASPNFFAFFPSTNSAAAIAGDLIASAMNTVGFTWQASPAATEMEVLALDWLAQMLNLPTSFMNRTGEGRGTGGGVILGTTSEAMLVTLVAARDAALRRSGSDGFRHHLDGVERVDSISMSPHKWLMTCLDCTCLYVRDTHRLTGSLETNPEYLKNHASDSGEVTDLKDMQVGVGRRFRGLKLWMVMRTYGAGKLQEHIRSDVAMAKTFEDLVRGDDRFEVVVPRNFALVCFRIRPRKSGAAIAAGEAEAEKANRELMERLNKTGKAYVAHTVVGGRFVLRFAVGSSLQEERHVRSAWELIKKTTTEIVADAGEDK